MVSFQLLSFAWCPLSLCSFQQTCTMCANQLLTFHLLSSASCLCFTFCLHPASCVSLFVFTQMLMFHFLSSPLAGDWPSGHNRPACLWCCFRQTFVPCMSVSCLCFTFCLHPWQEIGLQVVTDLLVFRPIVPIWEFDDRVFFAAGQPPPQGSPAGR